MPTPRIMTLDLRAPLPYRRIEEADPWDRLRSGEGVALFALDSAQALSFDPDPASYLAAAVFTAVPSDVDASAARTADIEIPMGRYLFVQIQGKVDRDRFFDAAVEVQRDGLWRRIDLEPKVFVRILAEESGAVFQLFRPFAASVAPNAAAGPNADRP